MKKILMFMIMGMFLVSFASAIPTYKLNEEVDYKITCLNDGYCSSSSYCNINIESPNSTEFIVNKNMTNSLSYHNYTLINNELGFYSVTGFCEDGDYNNEINLEYEVTYSGEQLNITRIIALIFVFLVSIWGMIFIQNKYDGINFDAEYNKLTKKYEGKNDVKLNLRLFGLILLKNRYIFQYLVGFVSVISFTQITYLFNLINIYPISRIVMAIYPYVSIIVVFRLFGSGQEWITKWLKDLQDIKWGTYAP